MPRYHFDLRDGEDFVLDEAGMELPDIECAQMEAAEFLSDAVKELTTRTSDPSGHSMAIEVRQAERALFLLSFTFSVTDFGQPSEGPCGREIEPIPVARGK